MLAQRQQRKDGGYAHLDLVPQIHLVLLELSLDGVVPLPPARVLLGSAAAHLVWCLCAVAQVSSSYGACPCVDAEACVCVYGCMRVCALLVCWRSGVRCPGAQKGKETGASRAWPAVDGSESGARRWMIKPMCSAAERECRREVSCVCTLYVVSRRSGNGFSLKSEVGRGGRRAQGALRLSGRESEAAETAT